MIRLEVTKRTDPRLLDRMAIHYSNPKGFVGRNICLAVYWRDTYYGHIVFGSATRFLPGRNEHLSIGLKNLNTVAGNIFYNISKISSKYPTRNFTSRVLLQAEVEVRALWKSKYGDALIGFETLVELPRTGDLYLKAGWTLVGQTIGYTCKRTGGRGSDNWSGKRVWNTDPATLRPKHVFVKKLEIE